MPVSIDLVLAMMAAIHPDAPTANSAHAYADAIVWVVNRDTPPGMDPELGAATLVISGWEEGRYALSPSRGDIGHSPVGAVCTFQIHAPNEATAKHLESNPLACTRWAYSIVVQSARKVCPRNPLAPFCGGCDSKPAQAIAIHRLHEADRIRAEAVARMADADGDNWD